MSFRQTCFLFCLGLGLICLAGGYGMAGQWVGASIVFLPVLALFFSRRLKSAWLLPSLCLVSLVGLAAFGLWVGAPTLLMILGATAALAAWNLDLRETSSLTVTARRFEYKHIQSVALALGLGLVIAAGVRLVPLQIPFVFLVLIILLNLFSLDRVTRYLKKTK